MSKIKQSLLLTMLFCLFLISGCANSEDSPKQTISNNLPGAFSLNSIAASPIKHQTLVFSWEESRNADYYTLCQSDAFQPGHCKVLVNNISGKTVEYTFNGIINAGIINTKFFILSNNTTGQTTSNKIKPSRYNYIEMIGYFRA